MSKTLNFVDVNGLIADAESRSARFVPTMLRRIRLFDREGILPVQREETGRREGRLDVHGACMAAVYLELAEFDFSIETLRTLKKAFDVESAVTGSTRFRAAVDAVRNEADVTLRIELIRRDGGEKMHYVTFPGAVFEKPSTRGSKALDLAKVALIHAELNLTALLLPVIRSFEAEKTE